MMDLFIGMGIGGVLTFTFFAMYHTSRMESAIQIGIDRSKHLSSQTYVNAYNLGYEAGRASQ